LARFLDHLGDDPSSLREWVALPLWDVCDGDVVLWRPGQLVYPLPGWIGPFLVVPPSGVASLEGNGVMGSRNA